MSKIQVEKMWEEFVARGLSNIPKNSIQYTESKKVFFSAVGQTVVLLGEILGSDNVSEEEGSKILDSIVKEVKDFYENEVRRFREQGH